MIYIDIGYKSTHHQVDKWRKDNKDKEATLIYYWSTLNQFLGISIKKIRLF